MSHDCTARVYVYVYNIHMYIYMVLIFGGLRPSNFSIGGAIAPLPPCVATPEKFADVLHQCNNTQSRSISKAMESLSSWLTALPVAKDHFNLSANEFCNGLALRYGKPLLQFSPPCDRCGAQFSVSHALDCRRGGLVMQRHNEVRDVISDLAGQAWKQITRELVIRNAIVRSR